jgi:hypothetical protein
MQESSRRSLIALAVSTALLAASAATHAANVPVPVRGYVGGSYFTAPQGSAPAATVASHYAGAKVCFDTNNNSVCDAGEPSTVTSAAGGFVLTNFNGGPLIAEIPATATNNGHPVAGRMVLRVPVEQLTENFTVPLLPINLSITPASTEVVRIMEDDGISYANAKAKLAGRLGVPASQLLLDPTTIPEGVNKSAVLKESTIVANRQTLAARMVDRHDVSPAALAANPSATGPAITMKEAQQAAMQLEGIPRYDHVFVIMLENKQTPSIKNSKFAPNINRYLNENAQFTSYYATGNPSEPNRVAVSAADDFGITDDSAWNCVPSGDTANLPEDPLPPGMGPCTNATNHNIKNKPNLYTALAKGGLSWRIYSESQNPNRDWRQSSTANSTILAPDHVYAPDSPLGGVGNPNLMVTMPGSLYATKHNGSVTFQDVRSSADFFWNNRTLGGGQWDDALKASPSTPEGWDFDQFGTDLLSGDLGNLNILEPDQCDDMHGVTVTGKDSVTGATGTASDCGGSGEIVRGDIYTDKLIKKIQASSTWMNTNKRVAIVIMFDEGTATTGFNACCGWNSSTNSSTPGDALGPIVKNADGSVSTEPVANYNQGNKGHGTSVFGVITNQPSAPKGVVDSDAYSHIAFVRTLQDMFGIADPANDWSYMNRSKYTEKFIAQNILYLPEYAGSDDTHFDAVRPMNHAYVIPADYVQKNGFPAQQVGPDANQVNAWALK